MEMVMVHLSRTRIWRDCRSAAKPSVSNILLLSPPLWAACPKIPQFQLKDARGELTSRCLTLGTLLPRLEEPVSASVLMALLAAPVGGTNWGIVEAVNDGPNNLQLLSNQAVEAMMFHRGLKGELDLVSTAKGCGF